MFLGDGLWNLWLFGGVCVKRTDGFFKGKALSLQDFKLQFFGNVV